jgi:hypothetical protein
MHTALLVDPLVAHDGVSYHIACQRQEREGVFFGT